MSSYYGRRASYVASWSQPRLYPRQEPHFEPREQDGATQPATPNRNRATSTSSEQVQRDRELRLARTRSGNSSGSGIAVPSTTPAAGAADVNPPPPIYYPPPRRVSQPGPGQMPSTNVARSQTSTIEWRSHPTLRYGWKRFVRVGGWYRCLIKREAEEFESGWPSTFGGPRLRTAEEIAEDEAVTEVGGERVSRSISRRSGISAPDSGVALTPHGTMETQHPLAPLFKQRVEIVNELVAKHLIPTRIMLAICEIVDILFIILLIVALGVSKGKQKPFLEAVEVTLVLLILGNGAMVNAVRMKRWALAKQLRTLARDWSPLPITTSTNQALINNYMGEEDTAAHLGDEEEAAIAERVRVKDQPTLRWSMRRTEGSWWLSYRPVLKIELVTPTGSAYGHLVPRLPEPPIDFDAEPESFVPPRYEE
ncbi:hypothetical protein T439DRAFT_350363 [Meredithblackwellia eburnea MCA 4105]